MRRAAALGDFLVVAVNDDAGVRKLKGPGRPIYPIEDRVQLLGELTVVPLVGPDAVDLLAAAQTEMNERSVGLSLAFIGAANADPELDRHLTALVASITGQDRRVLEIYRDRGWLRDDIPFDELVESAAVLCSIDTFVRITRHDGWTVDRYRAWLRRMLTEVVFLPLQAD